MIANSHGYLIDKDKDWYYHDRLPQSWRLALLELSVKVSSYQVYELYCSGWELSHFKNVMNKVGKEEHLKAYPELE